MRTSDVILSIGLLGLALGFSPAVSFDGTRTPEGPTVAVPLPGANLAPGSNPLGSATPLAAVPGPSVSPLAVPPASRSALPPTPQEAFRTGTQALRQGRTDQALMDLEYAAEQGVPGAIWKLGRMYADGDGVKMNKARAYEYFRRLTSSHGNESSGTTPNAGFVANAFVALGLFHLEGIPGVLKADPKIATDMFREAAAYYADPEAQYHLGRLYLAGKGAPKDAITAARWLFLSANKGDHRAQALLGSMLFRGDQVPRQAAQGLFWLTVAKEAASPNESWITETHASAVAQANESEKALAHKYLTDWLKTRRE
jgi:exopolysaccharide production negative regulator